MLNLGDCADIIHFSEISGRVASHLHHPLSRPGDMHNTRDQIENPQDRFQIQHEVNVALIPSRDGQCALCATAHDSRRPPLIHSRQTFFFFFFANDAIHKSIFFVDTHPMFILSAISSLRSFKLPLLSKSRITHIPV